MFNFLFFVCVCVLNRQYGLRMEWQPYVPVDEQDSGVAKLAYWYVVLFSFVTHKAANN